MTPDPEYPAPNRPDNLLSMLRTARRLAAPSWVMPGTIEDNCLFLAGLVDEVGLIFFDGRSSLGYSRKDLPPSLADLPLTYHLHLPLDLPWHNPVAAADLCVDLLEKTAFLPGEPVAEGDLPGHGPRAVLHPPDADPADSRLAGLRLAAFVRRFSDRGGNVPDLLVENTAGNDLGGLESVIVESGLRVCPDLGHMLAYGQESLLRRERLLERTALLHLNASSRNSAAHLPLGALDAHGRDLARRLCGAVPRQAVVMLELFRWRDILDSLPVISPWLLPVE